MPPTTDRTPNDFHALRALGPTEPWQVALYLPRAFDDFTAVHDDVRAAPLDERLVTRATLTRRPAFCGRGTPRLRLPLVDATGWEFSATLFGDTRETQMALAPGSMLILRVTLKRNGESRWVNVHEVVDAQWSGRVRPLYAGKPGLLKSEEVRAPLLRLLPRAVPRAAEHLRSLLAFAGDLDELLAAVGCPGWSLAELLEQAHLPLDESYGLHAQRALEKLAALNALELVRGHRADNGTAARSFQLPTLVKRIRELPFILTPEQRQALNNIAEDLRLPCAANHLLVGDVGCGKLHPTCALAAAVADEGGRAVLLQPNVILANQALAVIRSCWPDVPVALVTGEQRAAGAGARVVVATTAAFHRDVGRFDLAVIDESHKFGVAQKRALGGDGVHVVEVTATCIPRTQALARYGALRVSELRRPPVPKRIETRLVESAERRDLYADVKRTVFAGDRVLIIYPLRGEEGAEAATWNSERHAVRRAETLWSKLFPGRVRALCGSDNDTHKSNVIADLVDGRADVLVATTVIEAGVNIPRLRRVVIVRPERYGLSTLHQIRGRLAREGGEGTCDLYVAGPIKEQARRRLELFCRTRDGFEIARMDLEERGFGSLAKDGTRQSGADESFLFGRHLTPDVVDAVAPLFERLVGAQVRGSRG